MERLDGQCDLNAARNVEEGAVSHLREMQRGELAMDRRRAASRVAAINDVIVHERTCMQQLERRCSANDLLDVRRPGRAVTPVAERRPQPFASLQDEGASGVGKRSELVADAHERRRCLVEELGQSLLDAACQGVHGTNCRGEPDNVP